MLNNKILSFKEFYIKDLINIEFADNIMYILNKNITIWLFDSDFFRKKLNLEINTSNNLIINVDDILRDIFNVIYLDAKQEFETKNKIFLNADNEMIPEDGNATLYDFLPFKENITKSDRENIIKQMNKSLNII